MDGGVGGDGGLAVLGGDVLVAGLRALEDAVLDDEGGDDLVPELRGLFALEVVGENRLKMVSGPGGGSIGELMRYEFAPDGSVRSVRGGSGMTMRPFEQPA